MTDSRIFVTGGDLPTTEAEGMLLSVGSDLEPLTAMCRNLELRAGAEIAERLRNVGELPPEALSSPPVEPSRPRS